MPEILEVLHKFVDALADLKGLTGNRAAELHMLVEKNHAYLEHMVGQLAGQLAEVPDVRAGA